MRKVPGEDCPARALLSNSQIIAAQSHCRGNDVLNEIDFDNEFQFL